jgi:hypothetical protein
MARAGLIAMRLVAEAFIVGGFVVYLVRDRLSARRR